MHLAETWLERMHPQSLTFLPILTFSHKSSNSLNAPGVQTPIRRNIHSHTRLAAAVATMTAAKLMAVGVATLVTSVNASLAGQNGELDANNSNFLFRSARGRRYWDKVIHRVLQASNPIPVSLPSDRQYGEKREETLKQDS